MLAPYHRTGARRADRQRRPRRCRAGETDFGYLAYKHVKLLGVTFRTRTLEQRVARVQRCAADLLQPLADGPLTRVVHRTHRIEAVVEAHEAMARNEHIGQLALMVAA